MIPVHAGQEKNTKDAVEEVEMEISKNDWKLCRGKISVWQEKYMNHLNNEYMKTTIIILPVQ